MYGWLPVGILKHWGGEFLVHVRAAGHGRTNDQLVALIPVRKKLGRFFTVEYVTHSFEQHRARSRVFGIVPNAVLGAPQCNRPEFYIPHGGA
jgi:hypothetical protein